MEKIASGFASVEARVLRRVGIIKSPPLADCSGGSTPFCDCWIFF